MGFLTNKSLLKILDLNINPLIIKINKKKIKNLKVKMYHLNKSSNFQQHIKNIVNKMMVIK